MNILEELWYGNIQPMDWDKYRIEEHRDMVRLFGRVESQLIVTLDDGQKEEMQKLKDLGIYGIYDLFIGKKHLIQKWIDDRVDKAAEKDREEKHKEYASVIEELTKDVEK